MFCAEYDSSGLFDRSNPDRSRSSGERERVVADDLAWAAKFEDNRIIRNGPDAIEFVCYAKDDARCVRTIPAKLVVVRECDKLTVHAAAGVTLRNNLLVLDITVDTQIAPVPDGRFFERDGEGRIAQMRELLSVGVRLCERPETITAIEKELQMIAVRTQDSSGEAGVLVVTRPVIRWFEYDLLVGIALRFVEASSGLRLAENI